MALQKTTNETNDDLVAKVYADHILFADSWLELYSGNPKQLPTELVKLLLELEPAQISKLISDLKFRTDVRQMRDHLVKLTDEFVEKHGEQYVTVDLDTGEFVLGLGRGDSVDAFQAQYGTGRRRLTGKLGEMA